MNVISRIDIPIGMILGGLGYLFALQSHPSMSALAFAKAVVAHQWLSQFRGFFVSQGEIAPRGAGDGESRQPRSPLMNHDHDDERQEK
jgi:hypothetical protein